MKYVNFEKKSLLFYFKIIATVLIFWALAKSSQLKLELFSTLLYNPFYTLIVLALFYAGVILNTWRWYRLNTAQKISLSFPNTLTSTYLGIAFNNILPGSVGGDFVRGYYLFKKFPHQKSAGVLSIFFDRVSGLMGIIVVACLSALYHLDMMNQVGSMHYIMMVCFGLCILSAVILILSAVLPKSLGISDWLRTRFANKKWLIPLVSLLDAINVYRHSKLIILECLILSILNQLLLLVIILLLSNMMGLPALSPFDYILALSLGQIANLIPLTPGGVGIGEAAFANILLLLNPGMTGAYATVFFAFRLLLTLAYLPGVIIGIFGMNVFQKDKLALSEEKN